MWGLVVKILAKTVLKDRVLPSEALIVLLFWANEPETPGAEDIFIW